MSRSALVIGDAVTVDVEISNVLGEFGIEGTSNASDAAGAMQLLSLGHIDVVFVPVDEMSEPALAQLDRTIRQSERTEIVGTAVKADPEYMLKAMRAGIQEFLVRPVKPEELSAALTRVSRRHAATLAGSLIACYGSKGGVGVSSVAANLAYALSIGAKGRRVAIADLVVPNGEQKLQLNATATYDIRDVATKPERVDQELVSSVLSPVRSGLWLLASSDDHEVDDALDATVTTTILQHLRASHHYTVVDCDGYLNDRTLAVLDAAERILVITQLNVSALRATQRSLGIFRRLGYPEEKLRVVVNRYQSGEVISLGDAAEVLKAETWFKLPNDYKVMAEAASRGKLAAEVDASSRIAQAYETLAERLAGTADRNGHAKNGAAQSRLRGLFSRKK